MYLILVCFVEPGSTYVELRSTNVGPSSTSVEPNSTVMLFSICWDKRIESEEDPCQVSNNNCRTWFYKYETKNNVSYMKTNKIIYQSANQTPAPWSLSLPNRRVENWLI